ncbi:MAG: D-alanyl-D-alanine carboxypeptidase [Chloroflexi bacterium]|nr:MAG: D-alanyl-D-alanine carboxypeptidase [Chloroflexota bacterium]TMD82222.1 MAG: D-alanyl-D-alanine carboxypeptidase [Chloroflexota bacterium]
MRAKSSRSRSRPSAPRSTGVSALFRRPLPFLLALALAAAGFQYLRPLPVSAATPVVPVAQRIGTAPALPWPAHGEATLVVDGLGQVGSSGGAAPLPMASTAKMMTALIVLEDHPLTLNDPGPVITVSRADVSTFISERNQGESVLPVVAGEHLTEYQLLQGLLLPSASNFADMLATWDVGGVPAFLSRMNARAASLGMNATHYADVSGFSPLSVSNPSDLIALAQTAMRLPVFAQIVGQPQATVPVNGVIHNLDVLLGQGGVVGVKTGHTDQAGGCFVVAADLVIDGQSTRVYGAVMGQPGALNGAFAATTTLLRALGPALHLRTVIQRGDVIARYQTAWAESGTIVASQPVAWVLIDGITISRHVTLTSLPTTLPAGSRVGTLVIAAQNHAAEVPLVTASAISGPDLGWRLTRGF